MWFARALIFSLSLMPSAASATIVVGPPQPTLDEVVEDRAPGFGRLPAHALDRQQYLLSVCAHADDNQERNRRGFAVEADPHHFLLLLCPVKKSENIKLSRWPRNTGVFERGPVASSDHRRREH